MTMDAETARQERIMGIRRIVRQQKELIYAKRERKAAYHRQRYATLREHGLCVRCKQPTQHGMALCWSCQLYNNQRRSGARQAPRG